MAPKSKHSARQSKGTYAVKAARVAKRVPSSQRGANRKQALFRKPDRATKTPLTKKERREALKQRKMKTHRNYGVVADITSVWEQLRPREVAPKQRAKLISLALSRVKGRIPELVQNPKASRVLQACLQYGSPSDRQAILEEIHKGLATLSKSKYGKHLVQRLIQKTPKDDFEALFRVFPSHCVKLLKHQYGSDVMNDLYHKCSELQRHELMMVCYGKEFHAGLIGDWGAEYHAMKATGVDPSSLEAVMKLADPVRKAQVLEKHHGLLTAVIEKGLLVNRLIHRLILEFFHSAPAVQVEDMATTLAETGDGLLKMVHTEEGVAVAAAVVGYTSAHLRKVALRGFRDYVKQTVLDEWGHVLVMMAFRVVDDTKMLRKTLMTGLVEHLEEVCQHRYGRFVLLDLLHPRCSWYLPSKTERHLQPRRLEIPLQGTGEMRVAGESKKGDSIRRQELICEGEPSLEAALVELCCAKTTDLLKCRRGCDVLVEVARGAEGGILKAASVQAVQNAILQACLSDSTLLTDRTPKGAICQLIEFSKRPQPEMAKTFCKSLWKGVFKSHCGDWLEPTQRSLLAALMTCGSKSVRSAACSEVEALLNGVSVEQWLEEVEVSKQRKKQTAIKKRIRAQN